MRLSLVETLIDVVRLNDGDGFPRASHHAVVAAKAVVAFLQARGLAFLQLPGSKGAVVPAELAL
jgi:hypothetical protein